MDIHFYLNDKEVRKVLFKQFSSCSHVWFKLIEENKLALEKEAGSLELKYLPSNNEVRAIYDHSCSLLLKLEQLATNGSTRFLPHAQPLVQMSY